MLQPNENIVGRLKEREVVSCFLDDCISSESGKALFICGAPGTGKTYLINEELASVEGNENLKVKVREFL